LLAAALQFAGRRRYEDLAALLRHPDLEDWLQNTLPKEARFNAVSSLPAQLDFFYNAQLPSRIRTGPTLQILKGSPDLAPALERIETWLADASASHSLRAWAGLFRRILATVYGSRTLDLDTSDDAVLHKAFLRILAECDRLGSIPEALDTESWPAVDALQIAFSRLADEALPPPAAPEAVEILGWLELPLDDSRALIVTSFNEGFVPKSTGADPFLPDRFRRELGLLNNERRYARDAYATCVLCHSGKELRVLFARRDAEDNPCQPSRLVFACCDASLIRRAQRFFAELKAPPAPRRLLLAPDGPIPDESQFTVPIPQGPYKELDRISVTHFKAYLACPYRYYLRNVRGLEAVTDSGRELDGSAFGNLLHGTLSALGRDRGAPRCATREQDVFDFLAERMQAMAQDVYGSDMRRPSIRLQLEQARQRLRAFSAKQVALVREGWRIVHAEGADGARDDLWHTWEVDGDSIILVGRIDRIDFSEATGALRILDYKTADNAQTPDSTHRKKEAWIDLQLPLYRHLLQAVRLIVPADVSVELGYFNLPKQRDKTGVVLASWDDATLESADAKAKEVIRKLRDKVFWRPEYNPVPAFSEDFAAICLDNVFSKPGLGDDDEGGPP
jgi:hypothetical protein